MDARSGCEDGVEAWQDFVRSGADCYLLEPRPAEELVRAHAELHDCARVPYFLMFDACTGVPARPPVRD